MNKFGANICEGWAIGRQVAFSQQVRNFVDFVERVLFLEGGVQCPGIGQVVLRSCRISGQVIKLYPFVLGGFSLYEEPVWRGEAYDFA